MNFSGPGAGVSKLLIPVAFVATGIVLFVGGAFYGVITVGVPTPDASALEAAIEDFNLRVSGTLMATGLIAVGLGLLGIAGYGLVRLIRRST